MKMCATFLSAAKLPNSIKLQLELKLSTSFIYFKFNETLINFQPTEMLTYAKAFDYRLIDKICIEYVFEAK